MGINMVFEMVQGVFPFTTLQITLVQRSMSNTDLHVHQALKIIHILTWKHNASDILGYAGMRGPLASSVHHEKNVCRGMTSF